MLSFPGDQIELNLSWSYTALQNWFLGSLSRAENLKKFRKSLKNWKRRNIFFWNCNQIFRGSKIWLNSGCGRVKPNIQYKKAETWGVHKISLIDPKSDLFGEHPYNILIELVSNLLPKFYFESFILFLLN